MLLVPVATALLAIAVLRAKAYSPVVGWLFVVSAVTSLTEFAPVPELVGEISGLAAYAALALAGLQLCGGSVGVRLPSARAQPA